MSLLILTVSCTGLRLMSIVSCLLGERSCSVYSSVILLGKPSNLISFEIPAFCLILMTVLIFRFHTYDYARHFLSSCTRILGLETMPNGIEHEGRYTQVGTFPIGIDPMQFVDGIREPKIVARLQAMKKRFEGCKVSFAFKLGKQ